MKSPRIVYIGNYDFPDGNAAGKRVHGVSQLIRAVGYETILIDAKKDVQFVESGLKSHICNAFDVYSVPYPKNLKARLSFFTYYRKISQQLDQIGNEHEIFAIILYGCPTVSVLNLLIINYGRNNGIPVVADCVDFLSINSNNYFFNVFKNSDEWLQKRVVNSKCDGVIAVSTYIAKQYDRCGPTVVIPPVSQVETKNIEHKSEILDREGPVRLVYAGVPYRDATKSDDFESLKDRIDLIMKALYECKCRGLKFEFHIFGIDREDLLEKFPSLQVELEGCKDEFNFHGLQSNKNVQEFVSLCDFTILFRDEKRDTIAGFPTKITESINLGTPIIVTNVGDMDLYIDDRRMGFLSKPDDWESQLNSVVTALSLSNEELSSMKSYCATADVFRLDGYKDRLSAFLDNFV